MLKGASEPWGLLHPHPELGGQHLPAPREEDPKGALAREWDRRPTSPSLRPPIH